MIFYILLVFHFFFIVYLLVLLFLQQNSKSEMSSIASGSVFKNRTDNELAIRAVWLGIFLFFMTSIFLYKTSTKEKDKIAMLTKNNQVQLETEPHTETAEDLTSDTEEKNDAIDTIKNISSAIFSPEQLGDQELIDRPNLDVEPHKSFDNLNETKVNNEFVEVDLQEPQQEIKLEEDILY